MTSVLTNPRRLNRMFVADATNISRDPTMMFALVFTLIPTFALAIWGTQINQAILAAYGLSDIVRWSMPLVISLPPFLIGWVSGFLFLEDRDDATLFAIDVTPVGKTGFLSYRLALTGLFTFAITMINCAIFLSDKGLVVALIISVFAGLSAAIAALILPVLARNKVEGLAITKVTNLGSVIALLALLPSPFRLIAGIVPSYWMGEAMQLSDAQYLPLWAIALIGIATHTLLLWLMLRALEKRIG